MRMNQIAPFPAAGLFCSSLGAQDKPGRPKITGIDHLRIYVTDLDAHGVAAGKICKYTYAEHALEDHFEVRDPEGTPISFIQRFADAIDDPGFADPFHVRILHAGFVVKDRAVENHFHLDLLGFRLYWQGGFKDDALDWYEIEVPDGDNWVEYMLNIPANADHKELGVQNHFSLGVKDIRATAQQLRKNGLQKFDGPEIGRIEFVEFAPAQHPCCHPYTADHPKP
jgi:hypothetical protein